MCVDIGSLVLLKKSELSTWFNTLPYSTVESKITRDFVAQCSLLTYTNVEILMLFLYIDQTIIPLHHTGDTIQVVTIEMLKLFLCNLEFKHCCLVQS